MPNPDKNGHELAIRKVIAAPRAVVWRCWTRPELMQEWFCPKPWRVTRCEIDLRAGGRMVTDMGGPNGEHHENEGIYLEVVPMQRLVFTDAYTEGFVPIEAPFMTGIVELADTPDGGTAMYWAARHWSAENKEKHMAMGFEQGWGAAAAQLEELAIREMGK